MIKYKSIQIVMHVDDIDFQLVIKSCTNMALFIILKHSVYMVVNDIIRQ